jgi:ribosomal-protein-alanine N-acetyltransferase
MIVQGGSDLNWSGFRSRASLVERIEKDGYLSQEDGWLMVELASGEVVGSVGWSAQNWARPPYSRAWTVGMALVPEWRGRSVGRKAQAALCNYLFMTTGVNRIEAVTSTRNTAANRVLEACGWTREGVLREAAFHSGQIHDIVMYSILRREWQERRDAS